MSAPESCEGCLFGSFWSPDRWTGGSCRRYPPRTVTWTSQATRDGYPVPGEIRSGSRSEYPAVQRDEWCGEFKLKGSQTSAPESLP